MYLADHELLLTYVTALIKCACWLAVNVYLPKDRVTNQHQGYGFVEFRTEDDADYVRYRLFDNEWGNVVRQEHARIFSLATAPCS